MPTEHSRLRLAGIVALVVALLVVAAGLWTRQSRASQLKERAADAVVPTVALIAPSRTPAGNLELPARIEAWARAPIYARVSGYLKRWNVDIGAPVKSGQLLAEIEAPDLDQQLAQARAEAATARANEQLAAATAKRWQSLLESDSVSRQDVEDRVGDAAAKQATAKAAQANVERLQALTGYLKLTAPFDGVVTARNTDVGALIGVGGGPGSELFVVSDIRRLRVYVSVPQRQVAQVVIGTKAKLMVPERPGQSFEATVTSTSQAISSGSGAMLVQLSVANPKGELLPGGFATVRFDAPGEPGLAVPPGALITGRAGVQVATVDANSHVKLETVTITRDLGNIVEIAGIKPDTQVIDGPPDGISDGDAVRVAAPAKKGAS
ncbi:MAG: efflux RND transporter periplasmic adaptor subunit [Paucibacter sp.]|nr:efflux RND transporter periplasmic adaptor subunit [Roseateles sp.]